MFDQLIAQPIQILYNLPAIILGLTMHEFLHAYVAVKLGDDTPKLQGRLTINPLSHLDPIGFLMIILIGFGWAKPVQVNLNNLKNRKRSFLFVSLAGVFGNFIIALIAASILYFSRSAIANNTALANILHSFVNINLMLVALNLIPLPPLDGFNVLSTFVKFKNIKVISTLKQYGFYILIFLSLIKILGLYIWGAVDIISNGFYWFFGLIESLVG